MQILQTLQFYCIYTEIVLELSITAFFLQHVILDATHIPGCFPVLKQHPNLPVKHSSKVLINSTLAKQNHDKVQFKLHISCSQNDWNLQQDRKLEYASEEG